MRSLAAAGMALRQGFFVGPVRKCYGEIGSSVVQAEGLGKSRSYEVVLAAATVVPWGQIVRN